VVVLSVTAPLVGRGLLRTRPGTRPHAMPQDRVTSTRGTYTFRQCILLSETGQSVLLTQELEDGARIMNFIFTTCETTCPLSSRPSRSFRARSAGRTSRVDMVSDFDDRSMITPQRMRG